MPFKTQRCCFANGLNLDAIMYDLSNTTLSPSTYALQETRLQTYYIDFLIDVPHNQLADLDLNLQLWGSWGKHIGVRRAESMYACMD